MNKLTRILTMGGFGLLAALTTGAGAANASTAGVSHHQPAVNHVQWHAGEDVVGYYQNLQDCELAGVFGERSGDWDEHECTPVSVGIRDGAWALQVASDNDWSQQGFGVPFRAIGGFPTRFRPSWAGQFRPGQPGPIGHGPVGRPGPIGHGPVGRPGPIGHGPVGRPGHVRR